MSSYYFAAFFALDVTSQVDQNINADVQIPGRCAASMAVGRMMMNIRGPIMDDPEHTVHLQTIQFTTRTNLGAEIEDE
jgi:hypothetical protein